MIMTADLASKTLRCLSFGLRATDVIWASQNDLETMCQHMLVTRSLQEKLPNWKAPINHLVEGWNIGRAMVCAMPFTTSQILEELMLAAEFSLHGSPQSFGGIR